MPGAVGLYWVLQNLVSMVQTALMNKFYNMHIMNAMDEAARYARRENEEAAVLGKYKSVDIHAAVARLKERSDVELVEKSDKKTVDIYESIDAKNIIKIDPNQRVIKTGNAARAGVQSQKKKKK